MENWAYFIVAPFTATVGVYFQPRIRSRSGLFAMGGSSFITAYDYIHVYRIDA